MKSLKKIGVAAVLTFALALSVLAGEIPTPPCGAPQPGQIETPPCAAAPGDMETPTLVSSETSLTEIAADVILTFLPLF